MWQTDRQTDKRTDGQNYDSQDRPRICSHGKNADCTVEWNMSMWNCIIYKVCSLVNLWLSDKHDGLERRDVTAAVAAAQSKSVAKRQDATGSPNDPRRRKPRSDRVHSSTLQQNSSTNEMWYDAYVRPGDATSWQKVDLHSVQLLTFVHNFIHRNYLLPTAFANYFALNKFVHKYDTWTRHDLHICKQRYW